MNSRTLNILSELKAYVIITFGLLLYTLGWIVFLIPNNMVGGGVTGISAILLYAFNIPVGASFFVINLILLLIALKVLGKGFGMKTVYAIIIASVFYEVVPPLIPEVFIQEIAISNGKLLCAIFGGVCAGLGIGISFSQGGSTGGIDIIALVINKYREVSPGKVFMIADLLIISSILLLPGKSLQDLVYGYVVTFAFSYTVDYILTGSKQSVQMLIITNKYEEIANKLCYEMDKGVTAINSIGWYKKSESMIIMVVTRKDKMYEVMSAVKEVDNRAFLTVSTVMGVYGEGFDEVKAKSKAVKAKS